MASNISIAWLGEVNRTPAKICEFEWKIPDIVSFLEEGDKVYCSASFPLAGTLWAFGISPGNVNIHLSIGGKPCIPPISLEVSFSFKTSDGKEGKDRYYAEHINQDELEIYLARNCSTRAKLLERKSTLFPSNVLTVLCTVKYLKSTEDARIGRFAEYLKKAFLDGRMSDAVLKVDSREFNVHKVILVAHSPVFASMFEHDLEEKKSNVVNIPDCTAESFEIFLQYLYSGSIEALSASNVYNVYYAADKYFVEDLKEKCVEFIKNSLSVETVFDIISWSLHREESELHNAATHFFCKNIKKIVKTVEWHKYMADNCTHANELLIKALNA